jgi:two-component system sensor histidine kinase YesM
MAGRVRLFVQRFFRKLLLADRPLMTKLIVYSTLLVVIPMVCVGLISYRETSRTFENEAKRYSWQIIEQVKHYVEEYLRGFEINTLKIVNHPDVVAFLKLKSLKEVSDADIVPAVREVLKNSAYSQSDVINITLILDHIQVVNSAVQEGVSTVDGIEKEYWFPNIPVTGSPKVYSRVIEWNGRQEPVLSIVKRIANPNTLQPFGTLVIDVNYKRLQDVTRKVKLGESGKGYLFILDEQGIYVYHPDYRLIGTKAPEGVVEAMRSESVGSFVTEVGGEKQLLTFSRSDSLHWQVVTSIPYSEMMRSSRENIGWTIFVTTAIFTVLALVCSVGLAASLVRPIKRLYRYMKRVEIGDFNGKVPVRSKDEIGMLANGFNRMVKRLSQLLDEVYFSKLNETQLHLRQTETELKMLQAQINPHFLYNSLDTIRGMALEHDIDEIGTMAAALARLLRYNVKDAGLTVTIRQEVEIVEVYLRIQQFRFEDRLEVQFDVPDWAMRQQICKFTLQPLVENCIVHGMEPNAGKTRIRLSAALLEDGLMEVRVSDNGPGIPADKLEQLRLRFDEEEPVRESHIGVRNVHRRIRHVFGKRCGLLMESAEGEGTEVSVVLPYDPHLGGDRNGIPASAGGG